MTTTLIPQLNPPHPLPIVIERNNVELNRLSVVMVYSKNLVETSIE